VIGGRDVRGKGSPWFRRAVFVFSLVLVIVGTTLVFFASREADREKLVWEKEQTRKLEQAADLLGERLLTSLAETLIGVSRRFKAGDESSIAAAVLSEDVIAEAFVVDSDGQIDLPLFQQPYLLHRTAFPPVWRPSAEVAESYTRAERLEFVRKDFVSAAKSYRQASASARDKADYALVLNALARVSKKAGRVGEAEVHYRRLIRDFGDEPSEDGIPFGIIAALEIAQLESLTGRLQNAATTLFDCEEKILNGEYSLQKSPFLFYLSLLEELWRTVLSQVQDEPTKILLANRRDKLFVLKSEVLERSERAELIWGHFAAVPSPSASGDTFQRGGVHFLPKSIRSKSYLAGYVLLLEKSTLGVLFDEKFIVERQLAEIVRAAGLENDYQATLDISPNGTFSDRTASLTGQSLSRPFPPWMLHVSAEESAVSLARFRSKKVIYVLMALLLVAAIFGGGIMTIRSMAKEMELVQMKTDFVATVSHELRTPLTSIRYISELLKRGRVTERDRKSRYYETLYNESERLDRIIENLLDFSKIEAGMKEYKFEKIKAGPFTKEIARLFREIIAPKGFTLRIKIAPDLPSALMDVEAFGRALLNILDNAVKYSGEAREIEFKASTDGKIGQWKVTDQGLGIAPEDQSQIFDRFFRSKHGAAPSLKGSGIGLTIARHIVEAHHGSIYVESELDRGSTFIVEIPFLAESAGRTQ